nr:MAG TPA: hypothetical protein [Caudoviricetes sp.]
MHCIRATSPNQWRTCRGISTNTAQIKSVRD